MQIAHSNCAVKYAHIFRRRARARVLVYDDGPVQRVPVVRTWGIKTRYLLLLVRRQLDRQSPIHCRIARGTAYKVSMLAVRSAVLVAR